MIIGRGGFPARRPGSGGSGPPPGPDGTLPTFTTMTALDAGLTAVGRMAQLVGAATGAVILTCRRVSAGAGGLEILGPIQLWQASGTELDGAWAWRKAGTPNPTWSWGTPGDVTTGGINLTGGGYLVLPGFLPIAPRLRNISALVRSVALPGTPATYDGICVGWVSEATPVVRAGGIMYFTGPTLRIGHFSRDLAADPSSGSNGTVATAAAGSVHLIAHEQTGYGGTNTNQRVCVWREDDDSGSAALSPTGGSTSGALADDLMPALYARGFQARYVALGFGGVP